MNWLNRNAASARIVAQITGTVPMPAWSAWVPGAVPWLWHSLFCFKVFMAIRRFPAGKQINQGLPGPLGHARHQMLSTIHQMCMVCLRLHHWRQVAYFLAGSGPWPAPTGPTPSSSGRHGRISIFLENCADIPEPKSLQLSPRSDCIVLGKQRGQEGIYLRSLYIGLLERIEHVCPRANGSMKIVWSKICRTCSRRGKETR